jgi:hypothetical protein
MPTNDRNRRTWLALICALALVGLSACGSSAGAATPILGLEAISTYAAQTFAANMATSAALTPTQAPSPAAPPSPFPTFAPAAPLPTISFSNPTPLSSGGTDCDKSAFIADITIPDKTRLDPGQKFVKTWLVQNTGTCAWSTSYKLSYVDGSEMAGADVFVPLEVPVGQQAQLSVKLQAPTSPGDYYGRWKMYNASKIPFGSILTVVIKVGPLATDTPSP